MPAKIVAMALIPGSVRRGKTIRRHTDYGIYGRAAWQWWCQRNGVNFVVLDQPPEDAGFRRLPPTLQRWLAIESLAAKFGEDAEIAMVDADTMIHWDAPSLFDLSPETIRAVRDGSSRWNENGIRAFAPLFPGLDLRWWDVVNTGVVVIPASEHKLFREFVEFARLHWDQILKITRAGDVGTDQPLLNCFLRAKGVRLEYIPLPFNLLNCVNLHPIEAMLAASSRKELNRILSLDRLYEFIDLAWIWHFTNVVGARDRAMKETWKRIRHHYPGADIPGPVTPISR